MIDCVWCISILIVPARSCSLSGPLLYHTPVVFLNHRHPSFGNFNSAVPVDVIRVKSYVDSFLDPMGVSVREADFKAHNGQSRGCAQKWRRYMYGYGQVVYPCRAL